jgi:hypothetical protein
VWGGAAGVFGLSAFGLMKAAATLFGKLRPIQTCKSPVTIAEISATPFTY